MDLSELEPRQIAIIASRGRCVLALASIAMPGIMSRLMLGSSTPALKVAVRVFGIRDLALGVGALTALKERKQDAEWLSMGAACDGFDALVFVASPGLPKRARLLGLGAGAMSAYLMKLSRDFATEREAGSPAS